MNSEHLRTALLTLSMLCMSAIVVCGPSAALAQAALSQDQIVGDLRWLESAAKAPEFDELRKRVRERIRSENSEDSVNRPPIAVELQYLPNFHAEVLFDFDSDVVQLDSYSLAGLIADSLNHPVLLANRFAIIGNTDAKGSRSYNLDLSERRAQTIRNMLVSTFHVSPERLLSIGLGEEQLRDPANPDSAANRRVQLINLGPPGR